MKNSKKATLVLEDGISFEGISIGAPGERIGEVILNTAVVGYQEMVSDPTNAGKILVLTYPLIGNYGVADKFYESEKAWVSGLVIKEESRIYSNWQAEGPFGEFLKKEDIVTISGIDTRTLAVKIRDSGEMLGIISSSGTDKSVLLKKLKNYASSRKNNYIKQISTKNIKEIKGKPSEPRVAILDLGVLNSFVKQLKTLGCNLTIMPYDTEAEKILGDLKPDGVIISNGPEDDSAILDIVRTAKKLLGKVPILGISTGHEIMALALGGGLKRMKVGHHGVNYPVASPGSYKGEITVQNHSFVIDEKSLKGLDRVHVTLRNRNDNSIEEMESKRLKFISTQYYPASPGFDEINEVFNRFLKMIAHSKTAKRRSTPREVENAKA